MQHIWVEAAIDYMPSHGAINKSADSWVPMDASYKQNQMLPNLDLITSAGLHDQTIVNNVVGAQTISDSQDSISNLNTTVFDSINTQVYPGLQSYVDQNLPNATFGQVFGGRTALAINAAIFSETLPYWAVTVGARYGNLPTQLEQSITFALGVDALGDSINPVTFPWPQVNSHEIILSFSPSTPADEQALQSLLPSGQITDISQLPSTVPAYLINVTPQLEVDGTVVSTGASMTLGQEFTFCFTPNFAGRYSIPNTYSVIAGSYLDVAVIAGNVDPQILNDVTSKVSQTSSILQSQNESQISALTRERMLGDVFQGGLLGYYAQYIGLADASGLQQSAYHYLAGGIGTFGYEPHVNYTFGVPTSVGNGGLVMNVPIINVFGQDSEDHNAKTTFALEVGSLSSALEAIVPEQLLGLSQDSGSTISAVRRE